MSTKESNLLAWYEQQLRATCLTWNDAATAGQVAKRIGVSRTTAKKWLEKLVQNGMAQRYIGVHVNRSEKTGYVPNGAW